ncbi:MAG: hypothetical protein H5T72_01785 [Actinobacteria bacterium]|nr:hypothetical protein [Actinomycetota bacterium]
MSDSQNCPSCGLPLALNRRLVWAEDGGIYFREKRSDRLIFLEHEEISLILTEGVKLRGEELLDTLREKRRSFTRSEILSQLGRARRRLLARRPWAARLIREALREAAFYGSGNLSVTALKPRREMKVKVRHPYHPHLLAGDLWGFWEGLFGVEALVSMAEVSETEYEVTVKTVERRAWPQGKETPSRRPERDYDLEVCERCRLPVFPMEIRWDPDLGTIYRPNDHRRLVITSVRGWEEVLQEISGSRREELPPSLADLITTRTARAHASPPGGNYKTAYRNFFMGLPVLGWGKPKRVSRKPFLIDALIEGVPFPQLLSWKLGGVFQGLEKEVPEVEYRSRGDSTWNYLVGPRIQGPFLPVSSLAAPADLPAALRVILPF